LIPAIPQLRGTMTQRPYYDGTYVASLSGQGGWREIYFQIKACSIINNMILTDHQVAPVTFFRLFCDCVKTTLHELY
jgi:hypothetical protein